MDTASCALNWTRQMLDTGTQVEKVVIIMAKVHELCPLGQNIMVHIKGECLEAIWTLTVPVIKSIKQDGNTLMDKILKFTLDGSQADMKEEHEQIVTALQKLADAYRDIWISDLAIKGITLPRVTVSAFTEISQAEESIEVPNQ
ncbi:hypothetical protein IW262DRAFT_1302479 [Armillaria fumosa]|nr:hypothetical protein IW262DRAFT_1302479 [Armillaria fumosa]